MAYERQLSMIQGHRGPQTLLGQSDFFRLSLQVHMKFIDTPLDDFQLRQNEVRQIVFVCLSV